MSFIIIETQGGPEYAIIVTNINGNNLVFDERSEAEKEVAECQDGVIIEL